MPKALAIACQGHFPPNMNKRILHIAIPSIVSNVTVPLLGLVDTAITGHLGAASYLAAIAIGTSIFSLCYWAFGFLRMGTGGLTAQAFGRHALTDCRTCLRRALTIAGIAGVAIIVLQSVILHVALWLICPSHDVGELAALYFRILVWGAPANLGLSALGGWLLGMQNARVPMTVAIGQNVLNILASSFFVFCLGWKIEGVAAGTLIAQWTGCLAAVFAARRIYVKTLRSEVATDTVPTATDTAASMMEGQPSETVSWGRFFSVGRDIFLRTVCLVSVMFSFTAFAAPYGDITLAVNTILMQFFLFVSYVMDGFAYAGEAIGGSLFGAGDRRGLSALTRSLFAWAIVLSLLFVLGFRAGGTTLLSLLTDNVEVRAAAAIYLPFIIVLPLLSVGAFIYDGIFIGTTSTRGMLLSIAIATLAYFSVALAATPIADLSAGLTPNHALWIAFLLYLALRGIIQHLLMPGILRSCEK